MKHNAKMLLYQIVDFFTTWGGVGWGGGGEGAGRTESTTQVTLKIVTYSVYNE